MTEAPTRRRKLAAILMVDVSGFSAMMGRDEERTTELIQVFHQRVRKTVEEHQGRVVDTAGDSVFGEFDSVVEAVRCAGRIQEGQASANSDADESDRILTRIGVHLGDVIVEDERVYGDGVNIAARLEQLAEPGSILVSEAVYQQVHNKLELGFRDEGPRELKNIEHPVRLYSLPGLEREPPATVVETRPQPHVPQRAHVEVAAPPLPVPGSPVRPASLQQWLDGIVRAGVLVPVVVALGLLFSELFLFPSAGVLPTGGAILLGSMLGLVWRRLAGRRGNLAIGLGIGIASGWLFTDWGPMGGLFLLGGLAVVAAGVSTNFSPQKPRKRPIREKRRERRRRVRRPAGERSVAERRRRR